MKNQYYADSLDVAKWTILVRLATIHAARSILQIAMLTPDDHSKHGNRRDDPTNADTIVRRFFNEERASLQSGVSPSINRVKELGEMMSPPVSIEVVDETFRHRTRAQYFQTTADRLSLHHERTIVFLDPDIGIAFGRATDKHVTGMELRQLWEALSSGSVLVVFQHAWRAIGWRGRAIEAFARALEIPSGEITQFPYPSVTFLSVPKTGQSHEDLQNLVRRAWDEMADAYDSVTRTAADFYRTEVIGPGLLTACGDVRGLKVLDLGCGQGFFSRVLPQAGASVVGVDISERMIAHARRREAQNPLSIEYFPVDAAEQTGAGPTSPRTPRWRGRDDLPGLAPQHLLSETATGRDLRAEIGGPRDQTAPP